MQDLRDAGWSIKSTKNFKMYCVCFASFECSVDETVEIEMLMLIVPSPLTISVLSYLLLLIHIPFFEFLFVCFGFVLRFT